MPHEGAADRSGQQRDHGAGDLPRCARSWTRSWWRACGGRCARSLPTTWQAYGEATIEAVAPLRLRSGPTSSCTGARPAGFLAGPEGNARIVGELARATGAPVISTADAMVEALRHSGVRSTAVVTPYLPSVNQGLTRYVQAGGV